MARGDKNYPSIYFGRPGAMVTLPWPRDGIERSYERAVADFPTGGGQHIISKLVNGSRPYTLSWRALHADTYRLVDQYHSGACGQGPWALLDPSVYNMLMVNQAAATNLTNDATGFSASSGVVSSNSVVTHIHRTGATRSVRWLWSTAPGATTPTLSLTYPYRSWYGYPVFPGLSYAFSSWIKPDGTIDTSITTSMRLRWMNAAGSQLSEISGGDIATTAWTQHSVVGVAPAGAAYVQPVWVTTGSTVLAGGSMYVDEILLEQDTVVNSWAPGTGVRPVEILALTDTSPFNARFRQSPALTLREVVR